MRLAVTFYKARNLLRGSGMASLHNNVIDVQVLYTMGHTGSNQEVSVQDLGDGDL